jgi:hypothetical protein
VDSSCDLFIMAALEFVHYFYAQLDWAFASVYVARHALLPGSFGALAGSGNPRTWMGEQRGESVLKEDLLV